MSGASPPTTTAGFKSPQEPGKNCPDIVATYESNTDDFFLLLLLIPPLSACGCTPLFASLPSLPLSVRYRALILESPGSETIKVKVDFDGYEGVIHGVIHELLPHIIANYFSFEASVSTFVECGLDVGKSLVS